MGGDYLWIKEPSGTTKMVPLGESDFTPVETPDGDVDLDGGQASEPYYVCGECDRKFMKPHLFARHFNATHQDLVEDKDTWRDYYSIENS